MTIKKGSSTIASSVPTTEWGSIEGTLSNQTDLMNNLNSKASTYSPIFTGTPTAPTAATGTANNQIATTQFVSNAISTIETLPSQSGQSGKFLTTDGTDASWSDSVVKLTGNQSIAGNKTFSGNTIFTGDIGNINNYVPQTFQKILYLADGNNSSQYKFGIYQWGDQLTVVSRNANNEWLKDLWQCDASTGVTNFSNIPTSVTPTEDTTTSLQVDTVGARNTKLASCLQNTATGTNSLTILGNTSSTTQSVNIGYSSTVSVPYTLAIGYGASSSSNSGSIALGPNATSTGGGVSVGYEADSIGTHATAIGYYAISSASYSIQIGKGTNSTANTLSVGLSDSNNYQLLDSSGNIPSERLGNVKTIIETYINGTEWYRKWSDGWIEQGGYSARGTISLNIAFSNTNYTVMATSTNNTGAVGTDSDMGAIVNSKTTTSFSGTVGYQFNNTSYIAWYACGF